MQTHLPGIQHLKYSPFFSRPTRTITIITTYLPTIATKQHIHPHDYHETPSPTTTVNQNKSLKHTPQSNKYIPSPLTPSSPDQPASHPLPPHQPRNTSQNPTSNTLDHSTTTYIHTYIVQNQDPEQNPSPSHAAKQHLGKISPSTLRYLFLQTSIVELSRSPHGIPCRHYQGLEGKI